MKFIFLKKIFKRAFSLIELSIVIIIISILLSGALSIATSTTNSAKIKTTNNNIDEIYKALKVYLLANNRLPCPAPITAIKTNSSNYGKISETQVNCYESGVYTSTVNANLVYGMVPVQDLGLGTEMAEDGYGSKLAYIVDKRFTNSSTFGLSASNSGLMMTVKEITSAGSDQENTKEAIFLIISHGANKSGAFGVNSATQNTASDDGKEQLNYAVPTVDATASIGNTFYYRAGNSDVFDDVVFYKTRNMMVTESNAFNIISCPALAGTSSGISYGGTYMTWGEGKYGQIVTANSLCPTGYRATVKYPTKRCNTFGQWQDGVVDPCTESNISVISECTGGTITDIMVNGIAYKVHTFNSSGTLNCPVAKTVSALVVAGGGGGGVGWNRNQGHGGGAGGVLYNDALSILATSYSITVGNGGDSGSNGSNSVFSTMTAIGGGKAGGNGQKGTNGGSGGAGTSSGGTGASGQGNAGGTDSPYGYAHGGGGGAGAVGESGVNIPRSKGGNGGVGIENSITGTPTYYGGGGGGGVYHYNTCFPTLVNSVAVDVGTCNIYIGTGGLGGGGKCGQAGTNNTGGGGGGAIYQNLSGFKGGSGVVIVRYPN